jgi:hypothetical protein
MRDRQFGNCPIVEMNGSKMLQDSDRWRSGDAAKQASRFDVSALLDVSRSPLSITGESELVRVAAGSEASAITSKGA